MKATQAEDRLRRTDAFMCANDTATLSSGVTTHGGKPPSPASSERHCDLGFPMEDAGRRAGENTQALVLSQWARHATGLGVMVAADTYLCPLGATFDRLLHLGTH